MIGERLQIVRKHYGIKQAELANLLGVSKFTVQSWEQDKSNPSHEVLADICRRYHVSSDFMLGLSDELPTYEEDTRKAVFKSLNRENQSKILSYADFLRSKQ